MKLKIILLFVTILPSLCFGQQLTLVTTLQDSIEEGLNNQALVKSRTLSILDRYGQLKKQSE